MVAIRSTLAAVVATAAIITTVGVAGAGEQPVDDTLEFGCDTTTGNFVLTLTLENLINDPGQVEAAYGAFDGQDQIATGDLVFDPNPMPGLGTSQAVFQVPGSATFVGVDWFVDYGDLTFEEGESVDISEPCEADPTTTTSSESTTTTSTVAATAATRPTFTG